MYGLIWRQALPRELNARRAQALQQTAAPSLTHTRRASRQAGVVGTPLGEMAIRFYQSIGADPTADSMSFNLIGDALAAVAHEDIESAAKPRSAV